MSKKQISEDGEEKVFECFPNELIKLANSRIKVWGSVMISTPADRPTIKDVRDWLALIDQVGMSDETELFDCVLTVEVLDTDSPLVMCGEHTVDDERYDFLVRTHGCG
jgi:hypothetical protein